MKLDSAYNMFASGERVIARPAPCAEAVKEQPPVYEPLPPVQQQPVRFYPWRAMKMQ